MINNKLFTLLTLVMICNSAEKTLCFEDIISQSPKNKREWMGDKLFDEMPFAPKVQTFTHVRQQNAQAITRVNELVNPYGKYTASQGETILTAQKSRTMRPNKWGVLEINGYNRIGTDAFANRNDIREVIVNGVSSVGTSAFSECQQLRYLTLNGDLYDIGVGVCYACPNLQSVTMPDSVKFIDSMSFRFCPNLDRDALMSNFKGSHFHPKINKKMVKWYNRSKEIKAYEEGRAQRFQDDQDSN